MPEYVDDAAIITPEHVADLRPFFTPEYVDDAAILTPDNVADLCLSSSRPSMSKMLTSSRPNTLLICVLLTPEYVDDGAILCWCACPPRLGSS